MPDARVSIIIVNWRTPRLLAACLDSLLLDPRHNQFEFIVVDNYSNDGSVEMLAQQYPFVHVIANSENLGFSKACNQAIPQAQGQYVLLLNPDTVVAQAAVSALADFMEADSACGAAGPKVLNPDGTLQLACRRSFPDPLAAFFRITYLSRLFPRHQLFARYNLTYADPDSTLEVDALSGSCMMVKREAVEQVGLLDEDIFMFGEDIDWCWRIKQVGWKICYFPSAVVYHYHGAASRLRPVGTTINLHKGMEVFYRKHMAPNQWPVFNALVYTAIWSRAAVFILLRMLGNLRPSRSELPSLAVASSDLVSNSRK
jgi:GT2 family glycosyltransferase